MNFKTLLSLGAFLGMAAWQSQAALIIGTPSPSLSPTFGTLVNFDDVATDSLLVANHYAAVGVASIVDLDHSDSPIFYDSSSQSLPNYLDTGSADSYNGDFLITLLQGTSEVGIGIAGPNTTVLTVRDGNGNVLETDNLAVLGNSYYVVKLSSAVIQSIEIKSSYIAIDDLQFIATPEPSSVTLLGGSAILLGLCFKKRKTR